MLRSKPQRWIPKLRFRYPPLRKFSKYVWEKPGIFLKSSIRGVSAPALHKNPAVNQSGKAQEVSGRGPESPKIVSCSRATPRLHRCKSGLNWSKRHSRVSPALAQKTACSFPCRFSGKSRNSQERKISPKRKFLGQTSRAHPGVIRADIPAQNFGQGGQNPGKTSISARTSMTRRCGRPRPQGVSKNFFQKNLGLNFHSLNSCLKSLKG